MENGVVKIKYWSNETAVLNIGMGRTGGQTPLLTWDAQEARFHYWHGTHRRPDSTIGTERTVGQTPILAWDAGTPDSAIGKGRRVARLDYWHGTHWRQTPLLAWDAGTPDSTIGMGRRDARLHYWHGTQGRKTHVGLGRYWRSRSTDYESGVLFLINLKAVELFGLHAI